VTQQEFSDALVRFGFLIGNPRRTDAEDAEMESLSRQLELDGNHPGWKPCPRYRPKLELELDGKR
jgi:hypothetical protein